MDFASERDALADRVAARRDLDARVIEAIRTVPRHEFVPAERREHAYADRPLPIGDDQTISAPHMVAVMADALDLRDGESVLEIGTGCGYHAAVTAELVGSGNVYSVEYLADLAANARETLDDTGYADVHVHRGDGHDGWPEHAPYDAAYLTCAASDVPAPVLDQTRPGGRVVAPVGDVSQELVYVRVHDTDADERSHLGRVRFVPMQG